MHGEFSRLLFLQAHRETEAHLTATGMPTQRNQSDSFRIKRAAFYKGLKSKVGLAAAKARAPLLSPSFFHTIPLSRPPDRDTQAVQCHGSPGERERGGGRESFRESVLFIGTQFSILYTY